MRRVPWACRLWCDLVRTKSAGVFAVRVCSERPPQAPVCGEWACGRERGACTWCYNVECVCARPRAATGAEARGSTGSGAAVVRRPSSVEGCKGR